MAKLSASRVRVAADTFEIQSPRRSFSAVICGMVNTLGCTHLTCTQCHPDSAHYLPNPHILQSLA